MNAYLFFIELNVACMLRTYGKSVRSFNKSTNAQELETVYKHLSGKVNLGSSQLIDQMRNRKNRYVMSNLYSESVLAEWYPVYWPFGSGNRCLPVRQTQAGTGVRRLALKTLCCLKMKFL